MSLPISENWLSSIGFKWHEVARSPQKHWLLWVGDITGNGTESLGIELTSGAYDFQRDVRNLWFCWLRSDFASKYHRFIHVRHLRNQDEVVRLFEGLTGYEWNPNNHFYGSAVTPRKANHLREENERLDRRFLLQDRPKWYKVEEDETRGGALPHHLDELMIIKRGEQP